MYCIKCGVDLSPGQTVCSVCGTRVYHPDIQPENAVPVYPKKEFQPEEFNRRGILFVITILSFLTLFLPLLFELSLRRGIDWSGYVAGGVLLFYLTFVLPLWFRRANPVIFVPCDFVGVLLYLLYIDLHTGGKWFLSFAFPVAGALGLIITAIVALMYYLRRGVLYILGGGLIALGAWTVLIEFLIWVTFGVRATVFWSLFSLIIFFVLGMMLIVIAMVKPLRDSLHKVFFVG